MTCQASQTRTPDGSVALQYLVSLFVTGALVCGFLYLYNPNILNMVNKETLTTPDGLRISAATYTPDGNWRHSPYRPRLWLICTSPGNPVDVAIEPPRDMPLFNRRGNSPSPTGWAMWHIRKRQTPLERGGYLAIGWEPLTDLQHDGRNLRLLRDSDSIARHFIIHRETRHFELETEPGYQWIFDFSHSAARKFMARCEY